jgi:hypothetical protein
MRRMQRRGNSKIVDASYNSGNIYIGLIDSLCIPVKRRSWRPVSCTCRTENERAGKHIYRKFLVSGTETMYSIWPCFGFSLGEESDTPNDGVTTRVYEERRGR